MKVIQYNRVGGAKVGRSVFNLSYEKKFTSEFGKLIPILCEEMVPGDVFKIGVQSVIRFQPLVAPILHEINCYFHYFFVPYRILWDDWEDFITGGDDGTEAPTLPTWEPTLNGQTSLWDYLGFPLSIDPEGVRPVCFPMYAYNQIFNDYYRDEALVSLRALTNEYILYRAWEKDYFTSALPWQQRGTAPALPISGIISIDPEGTGYLSLKDGSSNSLHLMNANSDNVMNHDNASASGSLYWDDPALEVDLSGGTTFDIADLRLAFQIQRWLERNARAGARYTEFLKSHFGVSPRDDRLDRAEYIGGSKSPVIISEVLQTSETDGTPQGTLAGHGISVDKRYIGKYHAKEFGIIMGLMSVMPKAVYQQGINRQWIKETKYDYYFPEFAYLSEQPIYNGELYAQDNDATNNQGIFGYQGRYDEMRVKHSMVCAGMRDTYDYWHMSRQFSSLPTLNGTFIQTSSSSPRKDCFAAPSEPSMIVSIGNIIKAIRPMPIMSNPGLLDHV